MSTPSSPAPEDPRSLLASSRELTRKVRRDQGAAWFALLVFGLVLLFATPFLRYGPHFRHCATRHGSLRVCTVYPTLALWYWPVALLLGYGLIGGFYIRRSRAQGLGSRVQVYLAVGVLLAVLTTAWALWANTHPGFLADSLHVGTTQSSRFLFRLTSPSGAIGLALLVLAWIERTWLLAAVTVIYLVAVATWVGPPSRLHSPTPWVFLPHLLLTSSILLASAGLLGFAGRPPQRPRG